MGISEESGKQLCWAPWVLVGVPITQSVPLGSAAAAVGAEGACPLHAGPVGWARGHFPEGVAAGMGSLTCAAAATHQLRLVAALIQRRWRFQVVGWTGVTILMVLPAQH